MLSIENLTCGYSDVEVLESLSLSVEEGDFTCLLGSNNAGKSTLINTISGFVPVTAGRITFDGSDVTGLPPHQRARRGLAQVPEGRQLFPDMTVEENVVMGGFADARSRGHDTALLDEVYDLFPRVAERQQQRAGHLSGGEQQMVAIARGLMSRPRLLMLDEPSLGLAPLVVASIFDALSALNQSGVTILLVEQNLHMSLQHARYAYVLERGQIAVQGTSSELAGSESARRAYLGM